MSLETAERLAFVQLLAERIVSDNQALERARGQQRRR